MNEQIAVAQRILDDCFNYHQAARYHSRGLPCEIHFRCARMALGWREETNSEWRSVRQLGLTLSVPRTSDAVALAESITAWKAVISLVHNGYTNPVDAAVGNLAAAGLTN